MAADFTGSVATEVGQSLKEALDLTAQILRGNQLNDAGMARAQEGLISRYNAFAESLSFEDLNFLRLFIKAFRDTIAIGQLDDSFKGGKYGIRLKNDLDRRLSKTEALVAGLCEHAEYIKRHLNRIIVPPESPAPIRVGISADRVILLNKQTQIGKIDSESANRIRESLKETFSGLLEDLPLSSNADKRFIRACSRLLEYLSTPMEAVSIESFGLNYQLVSAMAERFSAEMGGSIVDEIQHTLTGIGVLLNQFQEWRDYLEELALTKLDPTDADGLVDQAQALAEQIEKGDTPVDLEVARRLRDMIEPVLSGAINADTVAAPLVGSLSNYFALLSSYVMDQSALVSGSGAMMLMGGAGLLMPYAIKTIQEFCPMISKYQPFKFLLDVMSWISSRYTQSKDLSGMG